VNEVTLGDSVLRREEEGPEGLIIQKTLNLEVGDLVKVVRSFKSKDHRFIKNVKLSVSFKLDSFIYLNFFG